MSYKQFTLLRLKEQFGLAAYYKPLFTHVAPLPYSNWLKDTLAMSRKNPIKSEKAKSEMIVAPVLLELKQQNDDFFTIYSGDTLEADKNAGLTGECDFVLAKNTQSFTISYPIFTLIEAKKNDFELGIDQCAAQMYGAWLFNQKHNQPVPFVYGCVTTADEWIFLKFEDPAFTIDT